MIACLGLSPALDVTYGVAALRVGEIHRPSWRTALAGGKSLNVARALRALQTDAHAIVPLGGGIGQVVREALDAEGIPVTVVAASAPTRTCVSIVDEQSGSTTEVYEHAQPLDDEAWRGITAAVASLSGGWLALSGAVPAEREVALAEILADAAGRGIRLALDVRGGALREVLARTTVDVVKINRAEAAETLGDGGAEALARRLHESGAATAIVTDGADGSAAVDASGAWRALPPLRGRYTVGSGDSFLAGLLASVSRGGELADSLRTATGVAAANTMLPGAARFDDAEATRLEALVQVEPAV